MTNLLRLLIVDDDPTMLLLCRRFFGRVKDVGVTEASSGEAAIELLRSQPFDAVLSDHRMGVATGIDVLTFALKQQPKAMRFMMSGFADPRLLDRAHTEARVHEFVEKPMTSQELETVFGEVIVARYFSKFVAQEK